MRFLRIFLVIYACLYLIGGIILFQHAKGLGNFLLPGYLFINATIIIVGTLFEKKRYKAKSLQKTGWKRTDERFIDQTSGKLMEVRYNAKTGERDYVEVTSGETKKSG